MKVGLISHSAQLGGAERSLLEMARALLHAGVGVCVCLPKRGPLCQKLDAMGVPHTVIPYFWWAIRYPKPLAVRMARHPVSIVAAVPVARFLSSQGCDVVVTNTEVVFTGAVAAGLIRKPHVWQLHELRHAWQFDLGYRASMALMRGTTALFLANSHATRTSYLRGLTDARIDVLYPGIAVDELLPRRRRSKDAPFRCLVVGAIVPDKRQRDAIYAVRVLRAQGVELSLEIIGGEGRSSDCRQRLERIVDAASLRESVRFVGYVDDPLPRIADADAVLVPSQESFGRVAVEAMLSGTPVIASRWGASPEIIRDGETGLLYEPGDSGQLAAQIRRLIDHPDERERLATAARDLAKERFGAQRFADRLVGVLTSVCETGQEP